MAVVEGGPLPGLPAPDQKHAQRLHTFTEPTWRPGEEPCGGLQGGTHPVGSQVPGLHLSPLFFLRSPSAQSVSVEGFREKPALHLKH